MCNHENLERIEEIRRDTIISYARRDTPNRVRRSISMTFRIQELDDEFLRKDYSLKILSNVNSANSSGIYKVIIEMTQVLEYVRDWLLKNKMTMDDLKFKDGKRIVLSSVKSGDIKMHCTCPDYYYRFEYTASTKSFNATGYRQTIPARITNPNNRGGGCKHILAVLRNNIVFLKIVPEFLRELKKNKYFYYEAMNLGKDYEDTLIDPVGVDDPTNGEDGTDESV